MERNELVLYDPDFARRQELAQAWEDLVEALKEEFAPLINFFQKLADQIVKTLDRIVLKFSACVVPARVVYLSRHGKTHRVRKKNRKRIKEAWRRLLK